MQLERSLQSKTRRSFGRTLIATAIGAMTYSAWAVQAEGSSSQTMASADPTPSPVYEIAMVIHAGGEVFKPRVRTKAGIPATIEFGRALEYGSAAGIWTVIVDLVPRDGGKVMSKIDIQYGKKAVASPKLIQALEETASVQMGSSEAHPSFDMALTVKEWKAPS